MKKQIIEKIIAHFEANEETFNECIVELDSYNGYLGDDRYYPMEYLTDFYAGTEPIEILNRAYFGYDYDTWYTDSAGNKAYGAFNPNREYFSYNGYGDLISTDYIDYSDKIDEFTIESMLENINYIDTINNIEELKNLFEELAAVEE